MNSKNHFQKKSILIEIGAYYSRIGFVGDENPKYVYRTTEIDIRKWYSEIFYTKLNINPSKYNIVILKDTGTNQNVLNQEAEILFTDFNIKGCAFVNTQTAILFSWAKGYSGLICDIGYQKTICIPIIGCVPRIDLVGFSNTAAKAIESYIINDLIDNGLDKDIISRNKEQIIDYLMRFHYYFNYYIDTFEYQKIQERKNNEIGTFEINDESEGKITLKLPNPILPEALLIQSHSSKGPSLRDCFITVLKNCLTEISAKNLKRIIICGGGSQVLGLRSFLISELFKNKDFELFLHPKLPSTSSSLIRAMYRNYDLDFRMVPPESYLNSSWLGGSIIFSLSYADNLYMTKQEFYEKKEKNIEFIDDKLAMGIKNHKI